MKNRTRAVAVIVAVLLIGCILGIAGYRFYERGFGTKPAISAAGHVSGHAGRLTDRLQLTREQENQLSEILENSRRQIEDCRKESDSKLQEIRAKTNERIAAILNDEQKKKFQQIIIDSGSHERSAEQGGGRGHH